MSHGRPHFHSLEYLPQIFYYNKLSMQSNENFCMKQKRNSTSLGQCQTQKTISNFTCLSTPSFSIKFYLITFPAEFQCLAINTTWTLRGQELTANSIEHETYKTRDKLTTNSIEHDTNIANMERITDPSLLRAVKTDENRLCNMMCNNGDILHFTMLP